LSLSSAKTKGLVVTRSKIIITRINQEVRMISLRYWMVIGGNGIAAYQMIKRPGQLRSTQWNWQTAFSDMHLLVIDKTAGRYKLDLTI